MSEAIREEITPPPLRRVLSYGKTGEDVQQVQEILKQQGFFNGTPRGNFLELTDNAVRYFQGTHIDREGNYLKPDGVVGPATWWALWNPAGSAQRSFIDPAEVHVEDEPRLEVLNFLRGLYEKGVREVPDGSNYGDGVTEIVNACGFKYGIAWCLALQSYADLKTFGSPPLDAMHVHCSTFWNVAQKWGRAFRKGSGYVPIPGDIGIFNYRDASARILTGPGHAVRVARVSKDGKAFNTYGGNEGNRLKFGLRHSSESSLVGFVNLFEDEQNPPRFEMGVTHAPTSTLSLASTR